MLDELSSVKAAAAVDTQALTAALNVMRGMVGLARREGAALDEGDALKELLRVWVCGFESGLRAVEAMHARMVDEAKELCRFLAEEEGKVDGAVQLMATLLDVYKRARDEVVRKDRDKAAKDKAGTTRKGEGAATQWEGRRGGRGRTSSASGRQRDEAATASPAGTSAAQHWRIATREVRALAAVGAGGAERGGCGWGSISPTVAHHPATQSSRRSGQLGLSSHHRIVSSSHRRTHVTSARTCSRCMIPVEDWKRSTCMLQIALIWRSCPRRGRTPAPYGCPIPAG